MMFDNFDERDLTSVSLFDLPPSPPERRSDARQMTVLRAAKLYSADGEELCLVRNISGGGLAAHVYTTRSVGEKISAEFRSGQILPGRVIWRRDDLLGMQFDMPVNPAHILAEYVDYAATARKSRALRIAVDVPAHIRVDGVASIVPMCDISLAGTKLRVRRWLERGCPVLVSVGGLPAIAGVVRWCDHEHIGIEFKIPLAFDALARWVGTARGPDEARSQMTLAAPIASNSGMMPK